MLDKNLAKIKSLIPEKIWRALWPLYHFGLAMLGNAWYRSPSNKLVVIGVTGTTGKTTSTYLIAKLLAAAGYKVGYTSTAMFSDGNREWLNDKKMTMPGRFFTYSILNKMVKNGCQLAIVETTSQGVMQYRHRFVNYDWLVFTGLYPEHVEAHGSFAKYREAKGMLFAHLKECKTKYVDEHYKVKRVEAGLKKLSLNRVKKTIIANGDDEHKDYFLNFWAESKLEYHVVANALDVKFKANADPNYQEFFGTNFTLAAAATTFALCRAGHCREDKIQLNFPGEFNIANALNAVGVALSLGVDYELIKQGLESVSGVPGRLEKIDSGQNFIVIVDYAFEPQAVAKLYETIQLLPHQRVIHVLGSCGGGRDIARRAILGKIAGEHSDIVIVTNEDPYDDDPQIIIDQVALGAEKAGRVEEDSLFRIMDRRQAIAQAFALAEVGDVVLITGKGSEQAICAAKGVKIPWDDRTVAREELAKLSGK